MDPLKEAAWKSDFKFKTKGVFLTLVPLATLDILHLDFITYVAHLTMIEIQTHNISGDRQWLHR
jgi:hypothetical protein